MERSGGQADERPVATTVPIASCAAAEPPMLPSIKGIFLFIFGLIPGVPGETIYSKKVGLSWRENKLRRVTRTLVISICGLILYILTGELLAYGIGTEVLIEPIHVMPSRLEGGLGEVDATQVALAYLGHVLFSTAAGVSIAYSWDAVAEQISGHSYPSAWESLVNKHSRNGWVIVTLQNGDSYAGMIETADNNVHRENRDVLLKEPAQHNPEIGGFVVIRHQYLFLPAELIRSVSVLHDPEEDGSRVTTVGETILDDGYSHPSNNGTGTNNE